MTPQQLGSKHFRTYPPAAREIATKNLAVLQQLPLAFLPLLLREVIVYDWKFPAERDEVDRQFHYFGGLSTNQIATVMASFAKLSLSKELDDMDWVTSPSRFSERLSAHIWATHQMEAFRAASEAYIQAFNAAEPEKDASMPRLGIVVIGQGIAQTSYPLFRKLRPHGVYFTQINKKSDSKPLFDVLAARVRSHPLPYAHWRVDGAGQVELMHGGITSIAYGSLAAARNATIRKMQRISKSQSGPEALHTRLLETTPAELGLGGPGSDPVLDRFAVSILTDGSGTQIYSTTFVQWTAREALRRARPLTLLATFAPRQSEESADDELSGISHEAVLEPAGSLVDADMGAYYTWLNMQRLSGSSQSLFLAWVEGSGEAVAIAPSLVPGTECHEVLDIASVLSRLGATT